MRARPLLKACLAVHCFLAASAVPIMAEESAAAPVEASEDVMLKYASELFSEGQLTDARNVVESILAEDPDNQNARVLLATTMIDQGEYDEARRIFSELIEDNPENFMMLNNYSWMLSTSKDLNFRDPDLALMFAQEAILLAPNNYAVWSTLAQAHYVKGNFDQAVVVMKECVELAEKSEAPEAAIQKYKQQLMKLREADSVMRLIE